jgi:hypothetical protein
MRDCYLLWHVQGKNYQSGKKMIHYLRALLAKLRGLLGDRRADKELDDEIKVHLRLLTERYIRQGMSEAEAASTARRQFGNITLLRVQKVARGWSPLVSTQVR